ncbi:MAG: hypothetical protein NZ992_01940 [Candidatus Korarchaeum sp.]|nr:hypothetical protein [Candidatus Korarchaeum sp.]MDW8035806.1 hypothetical protein [Candidatus Korarchaeum sp.]
MYWRKIAELEGGEVAILGVVVSVFENCLVVEDGTGRARVYHDKAPEFKPRDLVYLVGSLISSGEFKEVQAYAIANLSGIDISLLRKVELLRRKVLNVVEGVEDAQ